MNKWHLVVHDDPEYWPRLCCCTDGFHFMKFQKDLFDVVDYMNEVERQTEARAKELHRKEWQDRYG